MARGSNSARRGIPIAPAIAIVAAIAAGIAASSDGAEPTPTDRAEPTCPEKSSAAECAPAFSGEVSAIEGQTRAKIKGISWRPGCPVGLDDLRLVEVTYWGFDEAAHKGRLVVKAGLAQGMLRVMETLYRNRFPIRSMRLIDAYGASDRKSMAADNTSAFNCRFVSGRPGVWSQHAYGRAIDLNPVENPYVTGSGYVSPPAGRKYANRSRRAPGMVHAGDATKRAFAKAGWEWGGNWPWPKDYQHFSSNGR